MILRRGCDFTRGCDLTPRCVISQRGLCFHARGCVSSFMVCSSIRSMAISINSGRHRRNKSSKLNRSTRPAPAPPPAWPCGRGTDCVAFRTYISLLGISGSKSPYYRYVETCAMRSTTHSHAPRDHRLYASGVGTGHGPRHTTRTTHAHTHATRRGARARTHTMYRHTRPRLRRAHPQAQHTRAAAQPSP